MPMEKIKANTIDTDFKAAAVVAELIEAGLAQPDQVVILPKGDRQRPYAKEIADITTYESVYRGREMINVQINREGLYDMLPEGLFHRPPASSLMIAEEDMIKDIKQRREEEKQARNFFAPMEAEINQLRTIVELYEGRLDRKHEYDDLINIFLMEWKEFKCFTKNQMVIFLQVLPVINEHRNDLDFISRIFKMMFKLDAQMEYRLTKMKVHEEVLAKMDTKIGDGVLGVNFIAGRVSGQEEELHITIGPGNPQQIIDFLPDTQLHNALNVLLSYFIPLQTNVSTRFIVDKSFQKMSIGADSANACMGYTTYLGN
jgi:type VI secretion system protein ImpH